VFPFVFITIACGAISGFHALISSGTTPKLLENEADSVYRKATADPFACCKALGDDNRLGKEIVGELHIEGQIKSDGSLTDICRPMVNIGVAFQEFFESCNDLLRCID